MVGIIALAFLLALAWAIARINRRAGFGWFGSTLPFGALVVAILTFLFQAQLGFPATDHSNTMVMSVVMLIWSLQIILIAIRQWPALFENSGEGIQS